MNPMFDDEPPEFWPVGCLIAVVLSVTVWVVLVASVTWLIIR